MDGSKRSNFSRCLMAILVWLLLSLVAGLLAAFFGPGAAGIVVALLLGVCGMTLHIGLWAIDCTPHWSYAGLIFGSVTTLLIMVVAGSSAWQPMVIMMLFTALSVLSYVIYPVASSVLGATPNKE